VEGALLRIFTFGIKFDHKKPPSQIFGDPLHVDVAIRRWQNATGRDAVLLETGEPFNAFDQRCLPFVL